MNFIFKAILDWIWGKISGLIAEYMKRKREEKEISDLVKKDIDKLKAAQTEKEREDATKNLGDNF